MAQFYFIIYTTLEEAFKDSDKADIGVEYYNEYLPDLQVGKFTIEFDNGYSLGDVDCDHVITEQDAILVLQEFAAVSVLCMDSLLTDQQKKLADVSGDGSIDTTDASLILMYYSEYSILENTDITWEEIINR